MDDEEIIKAWYLLVYNKCYEPGCNPTEEKAAIRLYRMAEEKSKEELVHHYTQIEQIKAEIRASEREKVQKEGFEKGGWVQIDSKAFLIMMEKKEAEFRADERRKVIESPSSITMTRKTLDKIEIEAYAKGEQAAADRFERLLTDHKQMYVPAAFKEGYKKGQAELIAKGWEILQSYNDTALWHSKHFLLMLKKASDVVVSTDATSRPSSAEDVRSLGAKGVNVRARGQGVADPHLTATTPANPKPEKPCGCCDISKCEKHSYHTPPEKPLTINTRTCKHGKYHGKMHHQCECCDCLCADLIL